jgi:hypothetical protein
MTCGIGTLKRNVCMLCAVAATGKVNDVMNSDTFIPETPSCFLSPWWQDTVEDGQKVNNSSTT